jgi:carbohydrate-selective porin OprB
VLIDVYRAELSERMSIKPDLQYIINPGGSSKKDALAVRLRMELVL